MIIPTDLTTFAQAMEELRNIFEEQMLEAGVRTTCTLIHKRDDLIHLHILELDDPSPQAVDYLIPYTYEEGVSVYEPEFIAQVIYTAKENR